MELERNVFKKESKVFKALAHPTRLTIVNALAQGERCVCELQSLVGADISTVSRHLAVLREAGVIADDKRGNQVFYCLVLPCVMTFLECLREADESGLCEACASERTRERKQHTGRFARRGK